MTDQATQTSIEAAVFRKLLEHLRARTDVQNIDMMGETGFCRNCLSEWYQEAANAAGIDMDKDAARETVYGMPYADFKKQHQGGASDEQLAKMNESLAKNKAMRGW